MRARVFHLVILCILVGSVFPASVSAEPKAISSLSDDFLRAFNVGKYQEALAIGKKILVRARQVHGDRSKAVATAEKNLAAVYSAIGEHKEAETRYATALALREELYGLDHKQVSIVLNKLAITYLNQQRSSDAMPLVKRAIAIGAGSNQKEDIQLALSLYLLAEVHREEGRYAEAESLYKQAIAVGERTTEAGANLIGDFLSGLGVLYSTQHRYDEARPLLERALERGEKAKGKTHPSLASRLNNLARIHDVQGRHPEAIKLFERAIRILEDAHGTTHYGLVHNLLNLSALYQSRQQFSKALPLVKRACRIIKAKQKGIHPHVAACAIQMGMILEAHNDHKSAEKFYKMTAAIVERTYGINHPWLAVSYQKLVAVYGQLGQVDKQRRYQKLLDLLPPEGARHISLFFATNRNLRQDVRGFGSKVGPGISVGIALARIPSEELKRRADQIGTNFGRLEQNKSGALAKAKSLEILRFGTVNTIKQLTDRIEGNLTIAQKFKNQALVFIHGYNNTFKGALQRATQLYFDLQFDGAMVAFTWPSQGTVTGYFTDVENADNSVDALVTLLDELRDANPTMQLNLLAHSLGNRVMLKALCKIAQRKNDKLHNFGQVISAHADVSYSDFVALSTCFKSKVSGTTLYVNEKDTALRLRCAGVSRCRAGNFARGYTSADVVDTTEMSGGFFRTLSKGFDHDIFVRNPVLFSDISQLLLTGQRPVHKRTSEFRPKTDGQGRAFWAYDRSFKPDKSTSAQFRSIKLQSATSKQSKPKLPGRLEANATKRTGSTGRSLPVTAEDKVQPHRHRVCKRAYHVNRNGKCVDIR